MTVADVLERVSTHEFWDWQRFAAQHPFPAELIDIHGARQTWMTASVNHSAGSPPFELSEFRLLRESAPPRKPAAAPPMLEADRVMLLLGEA